MDLVDELCSRAESIDWTQFLETAQNEWETPFGVSGLQTGRAPLGRLGDCAKEKPE